jgi:hypothetical protein
MPVTGYSVCGSQFHSLPVAETVWRRVVGLLMTNELERVQKEAVVA